MLVFFDLPVTKKKERKAATAFRNFLLKDGYHMIQFSIYGRVCLAIEKYNFWQSKIQ
nr:CRISPR-associated endonuclease Cas2 [Alkalibacter saccharofermentans]